jgi:hypothetical protein
LDSRRRVSSRAGFAFIAVMLLAGAASAQVTPAAAVTPPDDTPSVRVGGVFYGDYTYTRSPQATDADGNLIHPSAFNVTRGYINITGNVSHLVSFRFTPDITRETNATPSLSGSLVYRIKYAFLQVNLDDWMTRGSWVRFGANQTPLVDYEENIYRYRFQGTVFVEREGFLTSSDFGASFHYNLPSNYGDVHVGYYNGDGYSRAEANDQNALQVRGTVRPFATGAPLLRGLRVPGFYDGDHYVRDAEKKRAVGQVTFEHQYLNAGFDYINAKDQPSITRVDTEGRGWSLWLTPRSPIGWEGLIRYDHLTPNRVNDDQVRTRTILGVAYWFPHQGNAVNAALLLDYDSQKFDNFVPAQPTQTRIAVHALLTF